TFPILPLHSFPTRRSSDLFPDLAIEVVLTSEGLDKLEIYRRLGVREVWFWRHEQFAIYHLRGQQYESAPNSVLLPDLNMALLARSEEHTSELQSPDHLVCR